MSTPIPAASAPEPRGRDIHEPHRVSTPLELLFDLSFVVAIAQATSQLHHGVLAGHALATLPGYLLAFFAIWWGWMNYSWFASAYDDGSLPFRLLTLVQMAGVLLFATGVPGLFTGDLRASVAGYVVMRVALASQWLRAARHDPARRRMCLRYAAGVALAQLGWVALLVAAANGWLTPGWRWAASAALVAAELSVPLYAERADITPWHAHHIAERYGLLVIIVLGECVLGTTNAVANMWQVHGWSFDLALVGFAGTLLVFALWWVYFLLPSGEALHRHRERAFGWGYGHFVAFAAVAAVGAGLEVVADALRVGQDGAAPHATAEAAHHAVSPLQAIAAVAVPQVLFLLAVWLLHRYAVRAGDGQGRLAVGVAACTALGPAAVAAGLPLPWGLLLLSLGPVVAIAWHEHARRHCADRVAVR